MSMMRTLSWMVIAAAYAWPAGVMAAQRTLRYGFTVENPTARVIEQADLWTYAPLAQTAYQECISLKASHPYTVDTDPLGNRILHFTFSRVAPYQQIQVRVEVEIEMQEEPRGTPDDDSAGLAGGPLFVVDPGLFEPFAKAFAAEDTGQAVEQIYRWSAQHIRYEGYRSQDRGAAYALQHRTGDCTEYMALMASACMQQDIPVRGIAGVVTERSAWINPRDLHNWTEILLDGRWWIGDPLKKNFKTRGDTYVALYRVGDVDNAMKGYARFRFEGDGLRVRMNEKGS